MSFLCRLGRHKPRGIPRWNDGLYFATCERCGRDLVRTAFEGWHVPSGYRVVWSDRPPASRPDVALIREQSGVPRASSELARDPEYAPVAASRPEAGEVTAHPSKRPPPSAKPPEPGSEPSVEPIAVDDGAPPAPASVAAGRLPIQDVLAHLHAQEAAEQAREASRAPAEAPPAPAPAPKRRSTWDFMDDEPFEDDLVPGPERTSPDSAPPAPAAAPVDPEVKPVSRKAGGLPEWWRSVRPAVHNFFSGPAEPKPMLVIGLALAVSVAVALAVYWAGYPAPGMQSGPAGVSAASDGGSEGSEMGEKPGPFAASAPLDEVAYVAARLLVCRDAPVEGARRVRNLLRGREVRVLGYDGAWASIDYRGGQCWAQAQYLSPVPPL
ncbi:MAG TPA: hypothetical protein VF574_07805 [Allosphingosinicella sp.]